MKLLKTTMAVAIASLLSSAAFAENASVEYQVTEAATPAVVTYNGVVILDGETVVQDVTGGHESVLTASANMKITELELPCALNNDLFGDDPANTAVAENQFLLQYSSVNVLEDLDDVVDYDLSGTPDDANGCNNVNDTVADGTTSGDLKTTTVALTIPADEVSYTVTPVAHSGNAPVAGTYRGTVTITTTATN